MAKEYRDRDVSAADRLAGMVAQFAADYEQILQYAIAESTETQAREHGASERDIACLRHHARCREQWRWN